MEKLYRLLRKFRQGNSLKVSQKILKIIAKNHSMLLWLPVENGLKTFGDYANCNCSQDYYVNLKSATNEDFTIVIGAIKGEHWEKYDFGIKCDTAEVWIRHSVDFDMNQFTVQQLLTWRKLSSSSGYLINELYNKVANQLQFIVELDKLNKTLETKKLQMS